jgi:hypothetical protein
MRMHAYQTFEAGSMRAATLKPELARRFVSCVVRLHISVAVTGNA